MRPTGILSVLAFVSLTACAAPTSAPRPVQIGPSPEPLRQSPAPTSHPEPESEGAEAARQRRAPSVYGGSMSLAGQNLSLVLELGEGDRREAGRWHHHARLWVPDLPLEALGGGMLRKRRLTLDLTYGQECPGSARLDGEIDSEGAHFRGTLVASDCTGSATGDLILNRRPSSP